jgi:hypothetical protein
MSGEARATDVKEFEQRNDVRQYLRRVRDGRTAAFSNGRVASTNEQSYQIEENVTLRLVETTDATLRVEWHLDTENTPENDYNRASPLNEESTVFETIVRDIQAVFETESEPDRIPFTNSEPDPEEQSCSRILEFHIPSTRFV